MTMSKREELIKELGDLIIDKFETIDDYDIEYDEQGFDNASISYQFSFEYGNASCDVEVYVSWASRSGGEIEIVLDGTESKTKNPDGKPRFKKLDRINDAVFKYVDEKADLDSLLDGIEEDYQNACSDEWNDHGFASEADYLHWRYG